MTILFLNPNSTQSMTATIVASARAALPCEEIIGWTNAGAPPAIQGPEDGEAAIPGLLALMPRAKAEGVGAIVIACFDDTGLEEVREVAPCPVIGIGEAAMHLAALMGQRFSVVTTLPVSVPVIEANVARYGFSETCGRVRASGLPVLALEEASEAVLARLADEIALARQHDGVGTIILGCAGMAALIAKLRPRSALPLIDAVAAAAVLASALIRARRAGIA